MNSPNMTSVREMNSNSNIDPPVLTPLPQKFVGLMSARNADRSPPSDPRPPM